MIVKPITFPNHQPLNRTLAAQVVQTASRFDARVMIRRHQKVVNAKSMLGLLSRMRTSRMRCSSSAMARMKKRHRRQCCRFLRRNSHFPS